MSKFMSVHQQITLEECYENPNFYLMKTEEGISLLNKEYDLVFGRDDLNFIILENDDLLITTKHDDHYLIYKNDSYGNVLKGPIEGWLEVPTDSDCDGQYFYSVGIGEKGIIDEDLNVIKEPKHA